MWKTGQKGKMFVPRFTVENYNRLIFLGVEVTQ